MLSFREFIASELSDRLRLRLALKIAIACLTGEIAVLLLNLSQGYWVIITIFVVMQFTVNTTSRKAVMRIVGTAAGCIVGLILVTLIPERHSLILSVLFFWSLFMLYISLRGIYPYAFILAALTPMVITFTGSGHMPGAAELAFSRFIDIAAGSTIAWLVTVFVLPVNELDEIRRNSGILIRNALAFALAGAVGNNNESLLEHKIRKALKRQEFLSAAADTSTTKSYSMESFHSVLSICSLLFIHTIHTNNVLRLSGSGREEDLSIVPQFMEEIHQFTERLKAVSDPKVIEFLADNITYIESLHELLAGSPSDFFSTKPEHQEIHYKLKLLFHVTGALSELSLINGDSVRSRDEKTQIEKPYVLFPGKRLDTGSALQALNSSLAVMIATLLCVIPFHNPQAGISALLVSLSGHQSPSYRKMFYRVIGTVIGGVAGFSVVIVMGYMSGVLFVTMPLMLFLFSYIGLGDEEWSYSGVTAGICFVLCISVALSQQDSGAAVLHRVEGVILGGIIAALVVRFLFPTDYRSKMKTIEAELYGRYRKCIDLCTASLQCCDINEKEFLELKSGLRDLTKRYRELIMDYLMDRMPPMSVRNYYCVKAETILDIFRGFVSMFHVLRHISIPPDSLMNKLLSDLLTELRKLTPGEKEEPQAEFDESKFARALSSAREALSECGGTSCGVGQAAFPLESKLYMNVLLHDINLLSELCRRIH